MTPTPETLPDLKPCPFCGGEAAFGSYADGAAFVNCIECEASVETVNPHGCNRAEAADVWNRRADTRPAPVSVKPLEWHNRVQRFTCSEPGPMSYSIMEGHNRVYGIPGEHDGAAEFASIDEAKDAAQQHYAASILSAMQPAPAVDGLLTELRRIATEHNCGCTPVCRCYEGENGRHQVEGIQDRILAALAALSPAPAVEGPTNPHDSPLFAAAFDLCEASEDDGSGLITVPRGEWAKLESIVSAAIAAYEESRG